MNKTHLGLHAWGNVVPCCGPCNNSKQQRAWKDFLVQVASEDERLVRTRLIEEFVASKKYDPQLNLHQYADNLYEDVGEVAMTLIQLRYKHAEKAIEALLESS
jgi:hypothetical protein